MDIIIEHNVEKQKFTTFNQGEESYLQYYLAGDTIDLASTYVPVTLRGLGIAQKLVEEGLKFANEHNLKIIPTCWYVEEYMRKNKMI